MRIYIQAYSLYVRQLVNDQDSVKAQALIHEAGGVKKLATEAAGWLLNVLAADTASVKQREELRQELMNRVQETAAGASLRSELEAGDYWVMHSARAANGIVLAALIKDQPQSDLIPNFSTLPYLLRSKYRKFKKYWMLWQVCFYVSSWHHCPMSG